MEFRWLATVALLVSCGALLKPPEPNRRLDVRMRGETFESDRGYRFAVLPELGTNIVRLDVRYPVGSIDDPPGKEGLAHLVEHLLFEAQFARGEAKTSISAELGRIAISWNAATYADHTTFEVTAPSSALDELIRLEVDRVAIGCAGLTPEVVAREREVVLNELRQRQGASGAALQRQIFEAVYPTNHPYRRVDSIDTVAKLELSDVCAFLAGPYLRGSAIIVASGDVDAAAIKASAGKHMVRLGRRLAGPTTFPPEASPAPGTVRIKADVDEPLLVVTWPLPPSMTPAGRIIDMVWPAIVGRIDQFALTYNWGHSTGSSILGGAYGPVLAIEIRLSSASKVDDAIEAVEKAIAFATRVLGETRTSPEWVLAWESEAESLLARWDSLSSRNEMFGDFMQYERGQNFLAERMSELSTSDPGSARALAEKYLSADRARYILIEPSGVIGTSTTTGYRGGAVDHPIRVDGTLADSPLPAPRVPPLEVQRYTLDNGLRVVLWPHGESSLVHGRLVIDSGSAHEPKGREGTALFVGADSVLADSLTFSGRGLANRVDWTVRGLAIELRYPGYDLSDEAKDFLRGRLRHRRAKERMTYDLERLGAVYGATHPYAHAGMTEASLDRISQDTVMSWARGHIVGKNATLVLTGKFDPELVKKHIDYNADQVDDGADSPDLDVSPVSTRAFIRGVTDRERSTVELAVHFVGGEGIDRDHAKRVVLSRVLDIRLAELRGRDAITYGFSADYDPRRGGGLWTIGGEADAGRAAEAATSLAAILAEIRENPESYRAAFVLARQKSIEQLVVAATSSSQIADRLTELVRFDLSESYYHSLGREIAGLTLAAFHQFVERELAVTKQVFGAFGNARAVDAALEAARKAP